MFNLDAITNRNNKDDDKNWPYRMLTTGPTASGKTNPLLNLMQKQNNSNPIDKIYLYAKDLSEPKYQLLIRKRENTGIKNYNDLSAFIEYFSTMDDVYSNIDDNNPKRKRKNLIVFDDMIADIMTNNRFQAIIKELFIRYRKLNISLVFITQSCFKTPKDPRLNSAHYLIMKIRSRRELQNIAIDHLANIDYKNFLKIYRDCTKESYSFLTIDTTLPIDSPMKKEIFRFSFIKMTLNEQVKILDDKIKANKAQYEIDTEAAKISALSSGELEKYEYLTGEDLGYKSDVIQKAKLEYSPLGKVFNKGLMRVIKKKDF